MLQFLTDYQLDTLLDLSITRKMGQPQDDTQSLLSDLILSYHATNGTIYNRIYGIGDQVRPIVEKDLYRLDQFIHQGSWNFIWTNLDRMRNTGYLEFSKCIKVDRALLVALDFSNYGSNRAYHNELRSRFRAKRIKWLEDYGEGKILSTELEIQYLRTFQ